MTKSTARLALLCAVVGLGASVAAAYVHYHLLFDPQYRSFCDVSGTMSCTQVYQSRFSTVWGIPISIFAGIWFVGAALLSVGALIGRDEVRDSIPGYLFAMSTPALAAVLYLLYISVSVLRVFCPMCLAMDAAVVGLFLLSGAATSVPITTLPRRAVHDVRLLVANPFAITVAILFFAGAASTLAFFPREGVAAAAGEPVAIPATTAAQQSELERFMATAPRVPLIVPRDGAKVLIVKFNDFQCPACGHSYLTYKPILAKYEAKYPGAVRMVLKDYPLNTACNAASGMVHPSACDAAVAVRLARQHDRGEAMEDWFYTHQPGMTPPSVRQAAKDIGQVTDFEEKYAATIGLVKADVALGSQLSIRSTPTFFINGIRVEGEWAAQYFDQAIAYELAHPPAP
jgi:uncharacterized membrane protein/protein-disulfide isomerase